MLVVGTLVVGPQNFLLRVFRGKGGGGGEEEEEAGEEKGEKGDKCKEKNKNEKAYIVMPDRKLDTTRFNETPLKEEIVEW
ncbi:hypothetical protein ScalyP_jg5890 [Parmales sp. scaly parma]|nr:hypothetical protein ScalyP_jg5890 [Parmales sp. scaly parma]